MNEIARRIGRGLLGGALGLLAMEVVRRATAPLVRERAPRPTDIFLTEQSISPLGPQHLPDEGPTSALARIGYQKVTHHPPPERTKRALSWVIHISYGLAVAAVYGAVRGDSRHAVRDGALFSTALWLFGHELAAPLLGLTDKPTAYHPTEHLQSLAQHLGFGVCTATATHLLEDAR